MTTTDHSATAAAPSTGERHLLKTGEEYTNLLRDNREIYQLGERIEDVTEHPATAGGVAEVAKMYDLQFDEQGRDLLTYVRDDGTRVTTSYLVPKTKEDLALRRKGIQYIARQTWGTHGRGMDMIATLMVGMHAYLPTFRKHCPEFADNIDLTLRRLEDGNVHIAETIVDPQGYRSRPSATTGDTPLPERATARITRESSEGIWISGVKGVGTAAPQSNELIVGSFYPTLTEESFWAVVPIDAPNLRMYCREMVHRDGASTYRHPLTSRGEEIDALVAFDDVFVPRSSILETHSQELHNPNFYNEWGRWEHWYTFVRIAAKAEMYAGLAQLIVDTLELDQVPVVRQRVADIYEFAILLQGMVLAAEETAFLSENGVMTPDHVMTTAARSYAQAQLPLVLHILQDICGQGMVLRFDESDLRLPAAYGKDLAWFLDTRNVSARDKNLVMNLAWDVAASEHATRSKIFEESNALNVPFLKERIYGEWDRAELVSLVRQYIGLEAGGLSNNLAPRITNSLSAPTNGKPR
ncbi:4-hydroxyphenylacetate 3-hydroxylase N-terminal domain-containing protein [Pseudonocardia sp. H11422]|uniref:4-hydroxyphenylacetate 3-hydroxylase N-terminal domain-containing protein n=1 Tax=Pseudonocardia sp. H11422 TaxID=2835866 RepID=UPI001BDC0803|nr:4-hydroxyphenylacetate 3-hydroxylase N-terminal domain-containing protein [Pseudonocardia sp. H11422]